MRTPPDRWSLLLQMTRRRHTGLVWGLLTALIIITSSCISTGLKPEMLGSHALQTTSQQAMAATAVPPMPIAAFDPQMPNFPNIRRAIIKTADFMALDLATVETAVSKHHDFDHLCVFKTKLLFPGINNLYFIYPKQPHLQSMTKITLEEQPLPSIGFYSQQTIMQIAQFPEPLTTSLYRPLAMKSLRYRFGSECPSRFSSIGMINVDFTIQTTNVLEIDLRDNDMHSLRYSIAFQISNRTNSFLDKNATMMLRLDQQSENNWDTPVIGTFQTPKTPVIGGQFIATSTADETMMFGHCASQ
jgi:hypothetical protein